MTRNELYNSITPCGVLPYPIMVYLINNLSFGQEQNRLVMLKRIRQNGTLSNYDWIFLFNSIVFMPNSVIDKDIAKSWLSGKCNLTSIELKIFLENVQFIDGSEPTYLLTENNDLIVSE